MESESALISTARKDRRRSRRGHSVTCCIESLERRALLASVTTVFPVNGTATLGPMVSTLDGNLWYTTIVYKPGLLVLPVSGEIDRITTAGLMTAFPLPAGGTPSPLTLATDGNLWFIETVVDQNAFPTATYVDRITPQGVVSEFALPAGQSAASLTAGPDGSMWFTGSEELPDQPRRSIVGRVDPSGTITEFGPITGILVGGLTRSADGNYWISETVSNPSTGEPTSLVGRLTPEGNLSEFPLPSGGFPSGLTATADGNLWLTELTFDTVFDNHGSIFARVTPSGAITEFTPPSSHIIYSLVETPDSSVWYTDNSSLVGRVDASGAISEFHVPGGQTIGDLISGPGGDIWFNTTDYLGRISNAGAITLYTLPSGIPYGLVNGPDGNLWFTEYSRDANAGSDRLAVGYITAEGAISDAFAPDISPTLRLFSPWVVGSDGNFWFSENQIVGAHLAFEGVGIVRLNIASLPPAQLNPPGVATLTGLQRTGVHLHPTHLVLTFSALLDPASASNVRNYQIERVDRFGRVLPGTRAVPIQSASYNATTGTVTLSPRLRLDLHGYYRVTLAGTLLSANGRSVDGSSLGLLHGFSAKPAARGHSTVLQSAPAGPLRLQAIRGQRDHRLLRHRL